MYSTIFIQIQNILAEVCYLWIVFFFFPSKFDSQNYFLSFNLQIWVYGNSLESSLLAVVNPNQQALEQWAEENNISGDFVSLCENPAAKQYILGELTKIGKEKKVHHHSFFIMMWL